MVDFEYIFSKVSMQVDQGTHGQVFFSDRFKECPVEKNDRYDSIPHRMH